ncbi:glycoside hydrolase family 25 protein [Streptomyces silvisoli]|uniref:GH25 family lysozyme n=1 Tax=Streptomyces silvisoli TaxID=3034235 RepID=A0ABT5ZR24_9ACTN|nr:GH25 family lysozyme [Streptomyces silvisoli]MDF3292274.1 GH25 family lysozyme [Streptomyces silvisoli]
MPGPLEIRVETTMLTGETATTVHERGLARLVHREIDHLDGLLGTYPVHGVDTSHRDHDDLGGRPFDWSALSAHEQFISIKATQGEHHEDSWLGRDLAAASSAGMIHTVFHWLDASESGTSQAEFFLKTVHRYGFTGTHSGELAPELDVEECVRGGQHLTVQRVSDFMERARADTGETPTLYIRRSFVEECLGGTRALAKYPVRLARYRSGSAEPDPLLGGTGWDFWQYREDGAVDGIGRGVCLDVFHDDLAALKRRAHLPGR